MFRVRGPLSTPGCDARRPMASRIRFRMFLHSAAKSRSRPGNRHSAGTIIFPPESHGYSQLSFRLPPACTVGESSSISRASLLHCFCTLLITDSFSPSKTICRLTIVGMCFAVKHDSVPGRISWSWPSGGGPWPASRTPFGENAAFDSWLAGLFLLAVLGTDAKNSRYRSPPWPAERKHDSTPSG